ncbi:hypothetical protein [Alienimonas californiensis]|uniref:Uncharacterized protein n=1 Tax=Alienimonas californiensis TaxID=2527989 RepID=A0A517P483_9PLAN|nr:hypothetical protein [Alienimonas californiensis]QDT14202.1 hypothetical protein CA12_02710 [Alienimonas californiensis]
MYRVEFADGGASILNEHGERVFSGTLEECENFLDWSENHQGEPMPAPTRRRERSHAIGLPAFLMPFFGLRDASLPRQPR